MKTTFRSTPWGLVALAAAMLLLLGACTGDLKNSPPEFIGLDPEYRVQAGDTLNFEISAKDADNDNVTIAMVSGPPGSDFIFQAFGRFVWTPTANDAESGGKSHDVVFEAKDTRGGRTTFRAVIVVEPSAGQTLFVTSNSRVLDLTRNDTLTARVAVQREDVTALDFGLVNAPEGMTLVPEDGKSATITWTPQADQIASKLIWGTTITVGNANEDPAQQNMTITLVAKNCGDGATQVEHVPLGDQRIGGDYLVEADIANPAGDPVRATLFWRLEGDPNDSGGFEGVPMDNTGGSTYAARIPNPQTVENKPRDIYYFVVAYSEADRSLGCLARAPEQGLNSFAAFASGDDSCRRDDFEPNDSASNGAVLASDTQGVSLAGEQLEIYGLAMCAGDVDYYAVDLEANQGVSALITYNSEIGDMHLRGLAPDGSTVILESTDMFSNESSILLPAANAGRYYIEVSGDPQGYRMYLYFRDDVDPNCIDNQFEPNEDATNAPILPPGTYEGLKMCPGDQDNFGVRIPDNHTLTARILFDQDQGDLDLFLKDVENNQVRSSNTLTDNEELSYFKERGSDRFSLQVRPINGAVADYVLELVLEEVDPGLCQADFFEPNNSFAESRAIEINGELNGSSATMCGDDDYYAVALNQGQTLTATIDFDHSISDLDMEIYDPAEESVAISAGTNNTEEVSWTAMTAGTHYVHVLRYSDMGDQDYQISINTGGGGPIDLPDACTDDTNEENGARALAFPAEGAQLREVGLCGADEDWFVFFPTAGQTSRAILRAAPLGNGDVNDITFELYNDSDQEPIDAGQFDGDTFEIEHTPDSNNPLYLRIFNTGNSEFGYQLSI